MGNASKILQTVAANIDRDVFEVALQQLADLVLLSDTTGLLTGEEDIYVQGVNVAVQRETQRQRQLEFLQHTNNPIDMDIMGIKGRGAVLRSVSQTIGLDGDEVVPSDEELQKKQEAKEQQTRRTRRSTSRSTRASSRRGAGCAEDFVGAHGRAFLLPRRKCLAEHRAARHLGEHLPPVVPRPVALRRPVAPERCGAGAGQPALATVTTQPSQPANISW